MALLFENKCTADVGGVTKQTGSPMQKETPGHSLTKSLTKAAKKRKHCKVMVYDGGKELISLSPKVSPEKEREKKN